ncbi:unnamed protein product, partial [Adineta ricciae]
MPVTTRAAAFKSGIKKDNMASARVSIKKKGRSRSRKQQQTKTQEEPLPATLVASEVRPVVEQHSTDQIVLHLDNDNSKKNDTMDTSIESLFFDQEIMSSTINEEKDPQTTSTTSETGATAVPIVSRVSLDSDDDDAISKPVVGGEITCGTSTRDGEMIYMNETKDCIGWRCVRRNENCKAVIYTFKSNGLFSHWNGKFHCHAIDLADTRRREIVSKIKHRVLDEFAPIKVIIEEEYRKAKLSDEEKRAMPLPTQIESGLQKYRRKALPPIPTDQKFLIPDDYKQTYGNGIPVCFALTSNRRDETYAAIFRCLHKTAAKMNLDFKPTTIANYRNIQKLGLMTLYDDDVEARELLRSFMALALLPIGWIFEGFELLKHKILSSEWQNRRFSSSVVQPHPNLWRFIQCLKQEEAVISHRMIQTGSGFSSLKETKSTRKAAKKTKQIDKLLKLLESKARSLSDTISSLSHLVGEP